MNNLISSPSSASPTRFLLIKKRIRYFQMNHIPFNWAYTDIHFCVRFIGPHKSSYMFISGMTDLWLKLANVNTDIYLCIYILKYWLQ